MNKLIAEYNDLSLTDKVAAEALSEPFLQADKYTVQAGTEGTGFKPAVAGVAYVDDASTVSHVFAVTPDLPRPYTAISEFLTEYEQTIGHYHNRNRLQRIKMPESSNIADTYHRERVIAKSQEDGLRTVAGFAIFYSTDHGSDLHSGFFVASKAAIEIPLEGRDYALYHMRRPETGQYERIEELLSSATGKETSIPNGMLVNDSTNQRFGMYVGALLMPELAEAKKILANDEQADHFLALPRKDRRKLLTRERKTR